ncbi:MAG: hypothetical protein WAN47_04275 [Nitrosotalea sp.]
MVVVEKVTKTKSMSFRLPEEMADLLETESSVKNINTSTLLTQICNHHFGYEGNVGKAGLIAFPRPLLIRLMEGQPEKQVIALAEHISQDVMIDIMSVLETEYTVDSFLHFMQSWAHSSKIAFRREIKGQLNTVVIQPELGKNWSLYLGHLFKNVIEELAQKRVAINVTDKSVMFRF